MVVLLVLFCARLEPRDETDRVRRWTGRMNAALQARELNAEATLLESKRVGGTSINEGPVSV